MIRRKSVKIWMYTTAMLLMAAGCATTQFERHLNDGDWAMAAEEFANDTSLLDSETALFRAAQLYSDPDKDTYNPALGKELYNKFVYRFPRSKNTEFAVAQRALLGEILQVQQDASKRIYAAENEARKVVISTQSLLLQIDSLTKITTTSQSKRDSLNNAIAKLEAELKDKDEQLRGLRAELAKLKQIDLGTKNGR